MTVGRGVLWKKHTVNTADQLDMSNLARKINFETYCAGEITWPRSSGRESKIGFEVLPPNRMRLRYSITHQTGKKNEYDYFVQLDTTPCYFGGRRWWFICPNTNCCRRCRILYLAFRSDFFLCRTCQNLTYRSQQEKPPRFDWLHYLAMQPRRRGVGKL